MYDRDAWLELENKNFPVIKSTVEVVSYDRFFIKTAVCVQNWIDIAAILPQTCSNRSLCSENIVSSTYHARNDGEFYEKGEETVCGAYLNLNACVQ